MDFPRIPFTKDHSLFLQMAELGQSLIDLHLMESPVLDKPITKFHGEGNNKVEQVKYNELHLGVWINDQQHFERIPAEIWNYQIGGYQICDKWLKMRKGKKLTVDEIERFCKVVTAIYETIEIQEDIDKIYLKVEKSFIKFD